MGEGSLTALLVLLPGWVVLCVPCVVERDRQHGSRDAFPCDGILRGWLAQGRDSFIGP